MKGVLCWLVCLIKWSVIIPLLDDEEATMMELGDGDGVTTAHLCCTLC